MFKRLRLLFKTRKNLELMNIDLMEENFKLRMYIDELLENSDTLYELYEHIDRIYDAVKKGETKDV